MLLITYYGTVITVNILTDKADTSCLTLIKTAKLVR